jgi:phage-related minor tail protein
MRFEIDLVLKEQGNKIAQLERDIVKLGSAVNKTNTETKNIDTSITKLSGSIKNLGIAVAGYITISKGFELTTNFAKSIIETSMSFEKLNAQLKLLTGSQEGATKAMEQIKEFAKTTPFEIEEVAKAFIKLNSFSLDGGMDALKTYGDVAAATGKTVDDVLEAISDARQMDTERLKELQITSKKAGDSIQFTMQTSKGAIVRTVKQTSSEVQSALREMFNIKFGGQMDAMANTLEAKLSNLKDTWTFFLEEIGTKGGVFDKIKESVDVLSGSFKEMTGGSEAKIKELGQTVSLVIAQTLKSINFLFKGFTYFRIGVQTIFSTINYALLDFKGMFLSIINAVVYGVKIMMEKIPKSISLSGEVTYFKMDGVNKVYDNLQKSIKANDKAKKDLAVSYVKGVQGDAKAIELIDNTMDKLVKVFESENKIKKDTNKEDKKSDTINKNKNTTLKDTVKKTNEVKKATQELLNTFENNSDAIKFYEIMGNEAEAAKLKIIDTINELAVSGKFSPDQLTDLTNKLFQNLVDEAEKAKLERIKIAKEESLEVLRTYEEYYTQIGDKQNALAAGSARIWEEVSGKNLADDEKIKLVNAQIDELKKSIFELKEEAEDISNNGFIEYLEATGREAEAANIRLSEQIANLVKLKQITDEQAVEMFQVGTKKIEDNIKAKKDDDVQKDKEKNDKKLQNEFEYYTTLKNYEIAYQKELEIYRNSLIEKGYNKQEQLDLEKIKVEELKQKYKEIELQELGSQKTITAGFQLYMTSLEERLTNYNALSQELFTGLESTLNSSLTSFFDYSSKGFMDLGQLATGVFKGMLQEIQQLIIKMLVMKTMQMAMGGGAGLLANANGNAFSGGQVQAFATGTVINSPTYFPMAGNKTGLMGEEGPEAIMPLTRTSGGKLGVVATGGNSAPVVNVNNYSSAQVSTRTNDRGEVDIELIDKIDKQLASRINAGRSQTDKIMNKKYNINKR